MCAFDLLCPGLCFLFACFSGEAKIIDVFFFLSLLLLDTLSMDFDGAESAWPEGGLGVSSFRLSIFLALLSLIIFSIKVSPSFEAGDEVEVTDVEEICLLRFLLVETELFEEEDEEVTEDCFCKTLFEVSISVENLTEEFDDTEDLWLTAPVTISESLSEFFLEFCPTFNIPDLILLDGR